MSESMLENTGVMSSTQRIEVKNSDRVNVVLAGPQGPPGPPGREGPPGDDAETSVQETMEQHVNSPEPHPIYDDIQDLSILFENGLF